jgi:hypothetical protein
MLKSMQTARRRFTLGVSRGEYIRMNITVNVNVGGNFSGMRCKDCGIVIKKSGHKFRCVRCFAIYKKNQNKRVNGARIINNYFFFNGSQ